MAAATLLVGVFMGGVTPLALWPPVPGTFGAAFVLAMWSVLPALGLGICPRQHLHRLNPAGFFVAGGLFVVLGVLNASYTHGGHSAALRALARADEYLLWFIGGCSLPYALAGTRWRLAWALLPVAGVASAIGTYLATGRPWRIMHANGHRAVTAKPISVWADFLAWSSLPLSLGLLLWLVRRLREAEAEEASSASRSPASCRP